MKVPMLPTAGALVADESRSGRYLRVAGHPEADLVVLSVWQDEECLTTVRLDRQSVSELMCGLARTLVAEPHGTSALLDLVGDRSAG